MTSQPLARARVLIIGATSQSDFITACQAAELFSAALRNGDRQLGRRNGTIYVAGPDDRTVYAWATETQITLHFGAAFPHQVAVATIELVPPDRDLPDWEDLRGRAPDATGALTSEAFVRELRDAWR